MKENNKEHFCVLADHKVTSSIKTERTREDIDFLYLSGFKGMHDQGFKGQGVKVSVLDTGINKEHEMFKDVNVTQLSKIYYGIGEDDNSHGTHVCGSIVDLVPELDELISIKVLDSFGGGHSITTIVNDITEGIYESVDRGVDIISMSIGIRDYFLSEDNLEKLHDAVKHAVANDIAVIVSCGNDSDKPYNTYPAFFPEVISVGAVDEWYSPAWFTSVSSEVDVCQVGVDVWSADYRANNTYVAMSGTSMAQPLTAGLTALMACKFKSVGLTEPMEPFLYRSLKMHSIDLHEPQWDNTTGVGFVTFKDDIRVMKFPYDEDAVYVNGEREELLMGMRVIKVDPDDEWSEVKSVLTTRELSAIKGDPVDWKPKDENGETYNGVIVRG